MASVWKPRVKKTLQDQVSSDKRPRKWAWDKRLSFMQENKPTCSRDWQKFNASQKKSQD